jgi:hypothetical protein
LEAVDAVEALEAMDALDAVEAWGLGEGREASGECRVTNVE